MTARRIRAATDACTGQIGSITRASCCCHAPTGDGYEPACAGISTSNARAATILPQSSALGDDRSSRNCDDSAISPIVATTHSGPASAADCRNLSAED